MICQIIIYITYLDSGISSNISKFADDTKVGRQINFKREAMVLQGKLNRMHEWAVKWEMDYINKCSTHCVGRHSTRNRYTIDRVECISARVLSPSA